MTEAVVAGRQPDVMHITPSKPNPWYGMILPDQKLTAQQRRAARLAGLDPDKCETVTVKRNATDREMYWGIGQVPPQYHFECPVLGRRFDGRIDIIAPSGDRKLVGADGWVGAPGRPKGRFW